MVKLRKNRGANFIFSCGSREKGNAANSFSLRSCRLSGSGPAVLVSAWYDAGCNCRFLVEKTQKSYPSVEYMTPAKNQADAKQLRFTRGFLQERHGQQRDKRIRQCRNQHKEPKRLQFEANRMLPMPPGPTESTRPMSAIVSSDR